MHDLTFQTEWNLRDGTHHAFGQHGRLLLGGIRHENGKLIPAQPEQHFMATGQTRHFTGHPDQGGITRFVPKVVVNGFEVIQVKKQQRRRDRVACRFLQHPLQFNLEPMPVVQACQ